MKLAPLAAFALAAALAPAARSAPAGAPTLSFPLACDPGRTCEVQHYVDRDPGPGARDYQCGPKTYEKHNGVDIRLPDMAAQRRGVAVLAAAPGHVTRLRDGVADVSVRVAGQASMANQECGNGVVVDHGNGWETQYCHMARGSIAVKQGDTVVAGTPLGKVGLSGNTEFPHLHITVRHGGQIIDPFAPDMSDPASCRAQPSMWSAKALAGMPYRPGAVLNAGFAGGPVTMEDVEDAKVAAAAPDAPYLVAYVRAIGLLQGDVVELELKGPGGTRLAVGRLPPLDRWKAQYITYTGKKRPPAGWPPGVYTGDFRVLRAGKVALTRSIEMRF
jgi:hypothetical protein